MPNAAIYTRVSREFKDIEKVSLDQQKADCLKLANDKGYTVPEDLILVDSNLSGKLPPEQWLSEDIVNGKRKRKRKFRPEFSKLIDAITTRKIEAVFIRKRNRLMRGLWLHIKFVRLCEQYGIKVFCTHDQNGSDDLTLNISAVVAEHQLKQSSEDTRAAKKYLKDHGRKSSPIRTLGYLDLKAKDQHDHKIASIDESTRHIVEDIFEKASIGWNCCEIADHCNKTYKIIPARNGVKETRFSSQTIRHMLVNQSYRGKSIDSNGDIVTSICYPRIIEDDIFLEAQSTLKKFANHKTGTRYQPHLFGGILFCDNCKHPMICKPIVVEKTGKKEGFGFFCLNKTCQTRAKGLHETALNEFADNFLYVSIPQKKDDKHAGLMIERDRLQSELNTLAKTTDLPIDFVKTRIKYTQKRIDEIDRTATTDNTKSNLLPWKDMSVVEKALQ